MSGGPNREWKHGDHGPDYHREEVQRTRHGSLFARPRAAAGERLISGKQALAEASGDASYDELGEPLRASITHKEWMWLSDAEKARFIRTSTEPEVFDDGI